MRVESLVSKRRHKFIKFPKHGVFNACSRMLRQIETFTQQEGVKPLCNIEFKQFWVFNTESKSRNI